jgi:hypothetical protein
LVHDSNRIIDIKYLALGNTLLRTYNFNLAVGDTFIYNTFYDWNYFPEIRAIIRKIDSVKLENQEWRKRYDVKSSLNSYLHSTNWIEGIGNILNPWYTNNITAKISSDLYKYYENGVLIFHNPLVGIEKKPKIANKLQVQKINGELYFESQTCSLDYVNIYSYTGKLLLNQELSDFVSKILLTNLRTNSPMLIVQVITKCGEIVTKKIVY